MLVSRVQPVMVLRAWFCIVCSLLMFVSDAIGDQMVLAYSMRGRVIVLYVVVTVSVSLALPQCVVVRALSTFIVCLERCWVLLMWLEYVSLGSSVRPRIFGCLTVGRTVSFMLSVSGGVFGGIWCEECGGCLVGVECELVVGGPAVYLF